MFEPQEKYTQGATEGTRSMLILKLRELTLQGLLIGIGPFQGPNDVCIQSLIFTKSTKVSYFKGIS